MINFSSSMVNWLWISNCAWLGHKNDDSSSNCFVIGLSVTGR